MVKLGFLGCGFMGQGVHLPNFLANPRCQVIALAEARPRLGRAVADKFGIPRVCSSHRELAADPDLQAVACIVPAELHRELVPELLAAGKHVYVEKPLAYTAADGEALMRAAAAAGVILMVAYMKRYDAGVQCARQLLAETRGARSLGCIIYARAHRFGGDWIASFRPPLLTTDESAPPFERRVPDWLPAELAESYLKYVNVYCHNINLLRWPLGEEPQVIHAAQSREVAAVLLQFDDVIALLETALLLARRREESATIFFERGWLGLRAPPPLHPEPARVRLYRAGDQHQVIEPLAEWRWSFAEEMEHFIVCVEAGAQPLTPDDDALRDLRVCEEIFRKFARP